MANCRPFMTHNDAHKLTTSFHRIFLVSKRRQTNIACGNTLFLLTYFDGAPKRTIYDNLKTLVESLFVDKQRQLNRRFLPLANYY